jgi:hypothetical protein
MSLRWMMAAGLGCVLALAGSLEAAPKSVIFYGNSFTLGFGSTRSVNAVFTDIATAAGEETPFVQSAAASGQELGWHLANNTAAIFTLIPPAQDWDFIVMQEHSTKLTRAFGSYPASVEASKSDAAGLYQVAATRSGDVVPVLYETFARGPGHSFYTGAAPLYPGGPSEMQAEVRTGYGLLKQAIDDAAGSDLTRIAPVGTAWEIGNYDRLHANDLWHAQNRGTLLAALVIYGTIYEDATTSDIDLSGVLASLGLTAQDGIELTTYADEALAVPEPAGVVLLGLMAGGFLCRRRAA